MLTLSTVTMADAFRDRILSIVPTLEPMRNIRWSFTPSQHRRLGARAVLLPACRNFDMLFGVGQPDYAWVGGTGTAYALRLAVATSYSGVSYDILSHMITSDAVDLRRALNELRDPTLPGLVNVEPAGIANDSVDSEANIYIEHTFLVSYHQATT